jgi:hypothetical protein
LQRTPAQPFDDILFHGLLSEFMASFTLGSEIQLYSDSVVRIAADSTTPSGPFQLTQIVEVRIVALAVQLL